VLVDVSGSMADRVRDADGERTRKILIAQRTTLDLLRAFDAYRRTHPKDEVVVGVYEFSARPNLPAAREVVPLGRPEPEAAATPIRAMRARGGTPIGDALIDARLALDRTGLRRRHLLVVTDGENTDGVSPVDVARVMDRQDAERRAALYFVAFDIDAKVFDGVKNAGGLVLAARDGQQLTATLDELLSDRILVEAPR
jgi:Mg-chelatase subunit ChlD